MTRAFKIRTRRAQRGWLRDCRGTWLGTWRVYDSGKPERITVSLGKTADINREEALTALEKVMVREETQRSYVKAIGPMALQSRSLRAGISNAGITGAAAELFVCLDLLAKGFECYRAVSPSSSCDLIYHDGGRFVCVEVKAVDYRTGRGARVDVSRNLGKFDVLALVTKDGRIFYRTHDGITNPLVKLDDSDKELGEYEC